MRSTSACVSVASCSCGSTSQQEVPSALGQRAQTKVVVMGTSRSIAGSMAPANPPPEETEAFARILDEVRGRNARRIALVRVFGSGSWLLMAIAFGIVGRSRPDLELSVV